MIAYERCHAHKGREERQQPGIVWPRLVSPGRSPAPFSLRTSNTEPHLAVIMSNHLECLKVLEPMHLSQEMIKTSYTHVLLFLLQHRSITETAAVSATAVCIIYEVGGLECRMSVCVVFGL